MLRSEGFFLSHYKMRGALWQHDGNPRRPHVQLTGDFHSNQYTNSDWALEDPVFLQRASESLIEILRAWVPVWEISRVIGVAMGAIPIAQALATEISRERANPTFWSYAEKVGQGKGKQIVLRRARILPGEKILLCEDALTTGGSTTMLATAVEEAGAQALPFVVTFANQSGEDFIDDRRLISGFRRIIPTWTPDQCPLCKDGSEAIPAKGENWKRLNAEY